NRMPERHLGQVAIIERQRKADAPAATPTQQGRLGGTGGACFYAAPERVQWHVKPVPGFERGRVWYRYQVWFSRLCWGHARGKTWLASAGDGRAGAELRRAGSGVSVGLGDDAAAAARRHGRVESGHSVLVLQHRRPGEPRRDRRRCQPTEQALQRLLP